MLLEDFVGELDRPIKSLDVLEDMIELMIEENLQSNEETKKVLALLYTMGCTIESIQKLYEKYNNMVEKEYEKIKGG